MRYKLFQPATSHDLPALFATNNTREILSARLEAAGEITGATARDQALAIIATDAAKAGEVQLVQKSIEKMWKTAARDLAIQRAAMLLAKRGLRKQAVDLAKEIYSSTQRDQTLSELAQ